MIRLRLRLRLRFRVGGHGLPAPGLPLPAARVPGFALLLPVLQLRAPPGPQDGGAGSLLCGLRLRSVLISRLLRLQRAAAVRGAAGRRRLPGLLRGECPVRAPLPENNAGRKKQRKVLLKN